jgi:glucosyl-dolichyl phosphate glucuronosyltransferase
MKISVILCTYNRSGTLKKALDSVAASTLIESIEWEVLVVDNNSRDQTRAVVEEFCRQQPARFRYLFESQQGKSHALNAGIREARGDVLAFMDDDVTVEPTWLHDLTAALSSDNWAGAGGRILPRWTCAPPRWLSLEGRYALGPLVAFDLGPHQSHLTEPPFGTNMAFRKAMFEKYGPFRTDLGPRPDSEIRGEDTEFGLRLMMAGERLRYEPSAIVYHPVPDNRLQKSYFLAWNLDHARANIRVEGIPSSAMYCWGVPFYLLRRIVVWTVKWMVAVTPRRRFLCKCNVWALAGTIMECYRKSIK